MKSTSVVNGASVAVVASLLFGCSGAINEGAPETTVRLNGTPREVAACVFEKLDKAGDCERGLRISNYERSGEARVICSLTATFITSDTRDIYSLEFVPADSKATTVRFWGHATFPGVPTYSSKIMPFVQTCSVPG